jgi:uncharacterized membrane protein YphA (DoxX/SURF4 family)
MNYEAIVRDLPALCCALFAAILFIQSGLDKVFDWSGNLEFIKGHFAKTFLAPTVPMMFVTITVMEVATGFLAAAGLIYYFAAGSLSIIFYSALLGILTITALFFGQRVAKDYPGAAVLVPYFLLLLATMLLSGPYRR